MDRSRFVELNALPLELRLGQYMAQMLYWGYYAPAWWRNYLHIHSFFEICYVYAGRGTFLIDGTEYAIAAGDVFVALPTLPHEIISSTELPLGIYFWAHTLTTNTPLTKSSSLDQLLDAFTNSRQYVSRQTATIQNIIDLITDEIIHQPPGYLYSIQALVTKLILDTLRALTELPYVQEAIEPAYHNPAERTAQTIRHYLHDNYDRGLSLRDVAAQVHLSERHASRLFKQQVGVSIAGYIASYRLKMASTMLLDPTYSIKEVAKKCGYTDVRYFTTVFHRQFGTTPDRFRKQNGTRFL